MTAITIGTNDLRAALQAVTPHADTDPDFAPLHRVRLVPDQHNVWITATNRHTAGLAIVSIDETHDNDTAPLDLAPGDVKEILTLFKATKNGDEDGATLRIDANDKHTTITDVSGLFPGKALKLPRYATEDNFPDVPRIIHEQLSADHDDTERVITNGAMLGLFGAAAKVYGHYLTLEPTGDSKPLVIACGESFLGLLMPSPLDDGEEAKLAEWRAGWNHRLMTHTGELTVTHIPAQA